jgi:hypothetical protein
MKVIILISLVLLAGCSTYPTLDQLEAEALVTGDWSAVEKRESILERRTQRAGPKCPDGYVGFCSDSMIKARCTCIKAGAAYSALNRY